MAVGAPVIVLPPASSTNNVGATAVLSVTAAGTAPFSYLWRKNGTGLPGATAPSLTLTNLQVADSGTYDAQFFGRETSRNLGFVAPSSGEW